MLISTLKDVFEREMGDRATTTPTGQFCRLLAAVWEFLPRDQRCATAESFVQYARLPLKDDPLKDDPLEDDPLEDDPAESM